MTAIPCISITLDNFKIGHLQIHVHVYTCSISALLLEQSVMVQLLVVNIMWAYQDFLGGGGGGKGGQIAPPPEIGDAPYEMGAEFVTQAPTPQSFGNPDFSPLLSSKKSLHTCIMYIHVYSTICS